MSEQEPPKIEFPCDYPIKVIGKSTPDFKQFVIDTVAKHAPDLELDRIDLNPSKNEKFVSVRLWIMATGQEQLQSLFDDLKASGRVTMVI